MVEILTSGVLIISSMVYRVVVLPEPVGPVVKSIPVVFLTRLVNAFEPFSMKTEIFQRKSRDILAQKAHYGSFQP